MKSSTLRRSNITREKVQMMEALSRYNRQHQDEDFYKSQNKTRELDALLQSFGVGTQRNEKAPHQPNQDYYIGLMNTMSYAKFVYPENKEEILDELQHTFRVRRTSRLPWRK